ncbi:MAG TPA: hypothetical protein VIG25_15095 [Pyrinomonadaceae bacterium]|jgi:hypothetical protein
MSDMLQLVVVVPQIQLLSVMCTTVNRVFRNRQLTFLKEVESIAPHDKLKHIGHLVDRFF